jgi:hypothetical protein
MASITDTIAKEKTMATLKARKELGETSTLSKLFPFAVVNSEDGSYSVEIRPLPIKKIPLISKTFTKVFSLKQQGKDDITVVLDALDDVLEMLQHCVDKDLDEVPGTMLPDLALAFLQQNFSESTIKKYQSLGEVLAARFGQTQLEK